MKKEYKFKPLDNIHAFYLILSLMIFIPFDLVLIFGAFSVQLLITVFLMNIIPIIGFVFVRIAYKGKYVIDNDYLIKYWGKQMVLKIAISDIENVYIEKANINSFFRFIFQAICGPFTKSHGTTVSFLFGKCEIKTSEMLEMPRKQLKRTICENCDEYIEIVSYFKCKKICKLLNITPKII